MGHSCLWSDVALLWHIALAVLPLALGILQEYWLVYWEVEVTSPAFNHCLVSGRHGLDEGPLLIGSLIGGSDASTHQARDAFHPSAWLQLQICHVTEKAPDNHEEV